MLSNKTMNYKYSHTIMLIFDLYVMMNKIKISIMYKVIVTVVQKF